MVRLEQGSVTLIECVDSSLEANVNLFRVLANLFFFLRRLIRLTASLEFDGSDDSEG